MGPSKSINPFQASTGQHGHSNHSLRVLRARWRSIACVGQAVYGHVSRPGSCACERVRVTSHVSPKPFTGTCHAQARVHVCVCVLHRYLSPQWPVITIDLAFWGASCHPKGPPRRPKRSPNTPKSRKGHFSKIINFA